MNRQGACPWQTLCFHLLADMEEVEAQAELQGLPDTRSPLQVERLLQQLDLPSQSTVKVSEICCDGPCFLWLTLRLLLFHRLPALVVLNPKLKEAIKAEVRAELLLAGWKAPAAALMHACLPHSRSVLSYKI